MKQLEITCLCQKLHFNGDNLVAGQVTYLPLGGGGAELARLRQNGGVRVREVERFQEQRLPEPVVPVARSVKQAPVAAPPPVVEGPALTQNLEQQIVAAVQKALVGLTPLAASTTSPTVSFSGPVPPAATASGAVAIETPVFIPSGLVGPTVKADITVLSSTGDADTVDSAGQALKEARRGRRK